MLLDEYLEKFQKEENTNEIAVMTALTVGMLTVSVFDAFKDFMSKAARQCFALKGSDRSKCMIKMRMEGTKRLIAGLEKKKSLCSKTRNAEKCIIKMTEKINKQKEKLQMYMQQFNVVSGRE